jgi:hypothetical protein
MSKSKAFFFLLLLIGSFFYFQTSQSRIRKTLLITGCARSGTNYITKALKKTGILIGHESVRRDGVSSWLMAVDAQQVPEGDPRSDYKFDHVFHQVRHPLKAISSLYFTHLPGNPTWEYILEHAPEIQADDSHFVKCAKYWYYWNLKAEEEAEWTYRIEDIDQLWDEFGQRIRKKINRKEVEAIPKDANSLGPRECDFTWADLKTQIDEDLYFNIQNLAEKYGYSLTD